MPSQDEEREHYGTHQNNPTDSGYRAFLCRLWEPLSKRLSYDAAGLDYGSGPGPTLHLIAQESGFECTHYDPFFHPDTAALEKRYDFITCSETAEHFHKPAVEFKRLYSLLKPDGLLGIMTSMRNENNDFASWHYRYDPTHVAFYSKRCFEFIGEQFKFNSVDFPARNVVILKR
ncbi:MAG: class I SAM-dependent methyltransferase [Verrucomicrobiota bacterium]